jgi:hypothetical protein
METSLLRFDPQRHQEPVVLEVLHGQDRQGKPDWLIQCDQFLVAVHSSSSFGYAGQAAAIEWLKRLLREDGYLNVTVKEIHK